MLGGLNDLQNLAADPQSVGQQVASVFDSIGSGFAKIIGAKTGTPPPQLPGGGLQPVPRGMDTTWVPWAVGAAVLGTAAYVFLRKK